MIGIFVVGLVAMAGETPFTSLLRPPRNLSMATLLAIPWLAALDKCPCGNLSKLYIFDTASGVPSGLNHQLSNLKALLAEGLGLGRPVLLRKPALNEAHNHHRPFHHDRWSSFIDLNRSTFVLQGKCRGRIGDCVADVNEAQLAQLAELPRVLVQFNQSVSRVQNSQLGLLIRSDHERVSLVRKLPGVSQYHITLALKPSAAVLAGVPPVLDWLNQAPSKAVVHVRRGDKITRAKYCPNEMKLATSPQHIARVLGRAHVHNGSIYVMSDETELNFFQPLRDKFGYDMKTSADFPHLYKLISGCTTQNASCENFLLFAIEKEIMSRVPPKLRFVTLPNHDLSHNHLFLMHDYLGPNKPCKSVR